MSVEAGRWKRQTVYRYRKKSTDIGLNSDDSILESPTLRGIYDFSKSESYLRQAKAAHTVKAYRSDWADFEKFCQGRELPSLPAAPATVAAYAAEAARRLKARTIERRLTAISQAHQMAAATAVRP